MALVAPYFHLVMGDYSPELEKISVPWPVVGSFSTEPEPVVSFLPGMAHDWGSSPPAVERSATMRVG